VRQKDCERRERIRERGKYDVSIGKRQIETDEIKSLKAERSAKRDWY